MGLGLLVGGIIFKHTLDKNNDLKEQNKHLNERVTTVEDINRENEVIATSAMSSVVVAAERKDEVVKKIQTIRKDLHNKEAKIVEKAHKTISGAPNDEAAIMEAEATKQQELSRARIEAMWRTYCGITSKVPECEAKKNEE